MHCCLCEQFTCRDEPCRTSISQTPSFGQDCWTVVAMPRLTLFCRLELQSDSSSLYYWCTLERPSSYPLRSFSHFLFLVFNHLHILLVANLLFLIVIRCNLLITIRVLVLLPLSPSHSPYTSFYTTTILHIRHSIQLPLWFIFNHFHEAPTSPSLDSSRYSFFFLHFSSCYFSRYSYSFLVQLTVLRRADTLLLSSPIHMWCSMADTCSLCCAHRNCDNQPANVYLVRGRPSLEH